MRPFHAAFAGVLLASSVAHAHFVLVAPDAYSEQDDSGLPQKSAPCGQDDPLNPLVETGAVTTFEEGSTITITVDEVITHPGHYRVALAQDQASLPAEPAVTPDGAFDCGTAEIQSPATTPGLLADNLLAHTTAFAGPQSVQVTLPEGACTHCTLQVIEFMSQHDRNTPGGCFYHHCAIVDVVPRGVLPDAGPGGTETSGGCGGCDAHGGDLSPLLALLVLALRRPRARGLHARGA